MTGLFDVALIHTSDLFEVCRYLKTAQDLDYASRCRRLAFETKGNIISFPSVPAAVDVFVYNREVRALKVRNNQ